MPSVGWRDWSEFQKNKKENFGKRWRMCVTSRSTLFIHAVKKNFKKSGPDKRPNRKSGY